MKRSFLPNFFMPLFVMAFLLNAKAGANPPAREYYEIRAYSFTGASQEKMLDQYLKDALVPGLHRAGIKQVGVFKWHGNDTASSPKIYLLIPYRALNDMLTVEKQLANDKAYLSAGKDYLDAQYDQPPYRRIEKTLLQAFVKMPFLQAPALSGPRRERVYELRSYQSPTEKLYASKVKMFNVGDEVGLFKRLGFNAVFYGDVIAGSTMPNLMYMTSFENKASRDEHWKAFSADAQWKNLSAQTEYSHTVSKSEIFFLFPTDYSDL